MGLDEVVRALREAAERCPESLWCMPGNSRQGAQTLIRCWGNHTNTSLGPARAEVWGKVLWLAGGSSLQGSGGFTATLSTGKEIDTEGGKMV